MSEQEAISTLDERSRRNGFGAYVRSIPSAISHRVAEGQLGGLPVIAGLIIIGIYFQIQSPQFLTARNLSNLLVQIAVTGTLAVGVVLVLLLGEIDLSIGSVMGVSAAVMSVLIVVHGYAWWVAILGALAAALAIGAFQAFLITVFGMPSFVVTLAGLLIWAGVTLWILGNQTALNVLDPNVAKLTSTFLPQWLGWLLAVAVSVVFAASQVVPWITRRRLGLRVIGLPELVVRISAVAAGSLVLTHILNRARGVPVAFLILLGFVCLFSWITIHTQFGRHIYAIGGNMESARRAGVRIIRVRFAVLMLSSLMAAFAAVLSVSRLQGAGTLTGGGSQLLEAIGAAVIGGASLFGGRGTVWAALTGALIMGSVSNGLDLAGQPEQVKMVTQGAILLMAIGIDTFSRRRQTATGR